MNTINRKTMGFSVNRYDKDGDAWEYGIQIHIDAFSFNIGIDLNDFDKFVEKISGMREEIEVNLNESEPWGG